MKISPNNRIPAMIDTDSVDGKGPLSVFESGAILQYLAEKTSKFLLADVRGRAEVMQWLFWQMGGLGPMTGQNGHFNNYAPEKMPYAIDRYVKETERLCGMLDERLEDREFIAGEYSIADMTCYPGSCRMHGMGNGSTSLRISSGGLRRFAAARAKARLRARKDDQHQTDRD